MFRHPGARQDFAIVSPLFLRCRQRTSAGSVVVFPPPLAPLALMGLVILASAVASIALAPLPIMLRPAFMPPSLVVIVD